MSAQTEPQHLTLICPNLKCRRTIAAPQSARGRMVRCAFCNTPFKVPGARPPSAGRPGDDDGRNRD